MRQEIVSVTTIDVDQQQDILSSMKKHIIKSLVNGVIFKLQLRFYRSWFGGNIYPQD